MQAWQIIILVFSGLGIFNSLAFVVFLNFSWNKKPKNAFFLQVILLAFILQIFHALVKLFNWNLSPYYSNVYLLGAYIQGPAMYLLMQKSLKPDLKIWPAQFVIHFLPYLLICAIKYDFENPGTKEWFVIYLVGIQYLVYIVLGIKPYLKIKSLYTEGDKQHFLIVYLFPVFAFLWLNYPFSGITGFNYQVLETILHSGFVYYLMFLMIKSPSIEKDKYKFSKVDHAQSSQIFKNVTEEVTRKEYFLDPDLTMNKLARKLNIPVNTLSQVINQNSGLNFRDFINTFRIEKAKERLPESSLKGFTISSVAFDCGFNSLSAFNRAFKKATGQTPSEFMKSLSLQ